MESYKLGLEGEDAAEIYLRRRGYEIIERNFRSKQGEVDIIARQGEFMVFVEVKNYSSRSYGSPVGAVGKNKKQSIIHAAETYLYRKSIKNTFCRFDVLTIYRRSDGTRIFELYCDAFTVC